MHVRLSKLLPLALAGLLVAIPSANATFPGRNGTIAYISKTSAAGTSTSGNIVAVNADGTGLKTLTTSGLDIDPAYSPDGTKIAFARLVSGTTNSDIWVMNSDGSGARQLTFTPPNQAPDSDLTPAWSPDGSKIAFQGRGDEIYVMNADGSQQKRLTTNHSLTTEPSFSPDGTKIAYVAKDATTGDFQIWVMNADGSGKHQLTSSTPPLPGVPAQNRNPDWSPNGTQLVFWSNRFDTSAGKDDVFVMDASGLNVKDLTPSTTEDDRFATWSPDGTKIAFRSTRGKGRSLYLMNPDGTGLTLIGNTSAASEIQPTWQAQSQADVGIALRAAPEPVAVGASLTYTLTVVNHGPSAAAGVVTTDALPAGATFVSASPGCTGTATVTCSMGTLASGASSTATIVVKPTAPGALPDTATVKHSELDIVSANDSASVSSTVVPAGTTSSGGSGGSKPLKCTITGTAGNDVLRGTPGRDVICGLGGNDRINGLGGNDVIYGGPGNDVLVGGKGNDLIYGNAGNDVLTGGAGNDVLDGGAGNDKLSGNAGNDILRGGAGNDVLNGGPGQDALFGDAGNDTLISRDKARDRLNGGAGKNRAKADPPTVDSSRGITRFY